MSRVPVDKLPLTTRKNIRDVYESKRPGFESELSQLLGTTWTIALNPNVVFPYIDRDDLKDRLGTSVVWYIEPFLRNLKVFIDKYGQDGKSEINDLAPSHVLELGPQTSTDYKYGGISFENGAMRLVFADGQYSVNCSYISEPEVIVEGIKKAPKAAGGSSLTMEIKNSIDTKYKPKIGDVQAKIGQQVGVASITLNPNFEHNAAVMAKAQGAGGNWEKQIGTVILNYFESLASHLESNKFGSDDMLQEAFQETVSKNEVQFRLVDKTKTGKRNEAVVEDGIMYLQTDPGNWWVNYNDTAQNIMGLF